MDTISYSLAINACQYSKARDEIKFPLPIVIRPIIIPKYTKIKLDQLGWYDPSTEKDREFSYSARITLFQSIST